MKYEDNLKKEIHVPSRTTLAIVCWVIACSLYSCASQTDPVGSCTYTRTPGTATIVSLNSAPGGSNNCNNIPVEVVFDFVPLDLVAAIPATDNQRLLTVGDGKNPPLDYVLAKGLTVGSTHPCTRQIITSGVCTPVLFTFTDIDLSDYAASCF